MQQSESPPVPPTRAVPSQRTNDSSQPVLARRLGHFIVSVDLCTGNGQDDLPIFSFKQPGEITFLCRVHPQNGADRSFVFSIYLYRQILRNTLSGLQSTRRSDDTAKPPRFPPGRSAIPFDMPTASLVTGTSLVKGAQSHVLQDQSGNGFRGHYFVFPDLVSWSRSCSMRYYSKTTIAKRS